MTRRSSPRLVTLSKRSWPDGSTKKFTWKEKGKNREGFVIRQGEAYHAYVNLCRHLPISLDLNDNQFLSHDGKHLQCHMHGALYEIDSGLCVGGPCLGARLFKLEVEEEESQLVIIIPETTGE